MTEQDPLNSASTAFLLLRVAKRLGASSSFHFSSLSSDCGYHLGLEYLLRSISARFLGRPQKLNEQTYFSPLFSLKKYDTFKQPYNILSEEKESMAQITG